MADIVKLTNTKTQWLLELLNCQNLDIQVIQDDNGILNVQINTDDSNAGLLIGFHGENISALQTILSQVVNKGKAEWNPVLVNVGDYREKRNQTLINLANNAAERVKQTKKPVTLPFLSGSERRIIHMALAEDGEVETYSKGLGRERRLTIDLKHDS